MYPGHLLQRDNSPPNILDTVPSWRAGVACVPHWMWLSPLSTKVQDVALHGQPVNESTVRLSSNDNPKSSKLISPIDCGFLKLEF